MHARQGREKLETQENLAKVMEESIIPFITKYLSKKGFITNQLVVNRDPSFKPRRELRALSYLRNKKCVKREYDGLWIVSDTDGRWVLLNNASQLHLTREKFNKIQKAISDLFITMIPSWKVASEEDPLECRCPIALEEWIRTSTPLCTSLLVTYFTIEEGFDIREVSDDSMNIEFVQFDLFAMEEASTTLETAIDKLLKPWCKKIELSTCYDVHTGFLRKG